MNDRWELPGKTCPAWIETGNKLLAGISYQKPLNDGGVATDWRTKRSRRAAKSLMTCCTIPPHSLSRSNRGKNCREDPKTRGAGPGENRRNRMQNERPVIPGQLRHGQAFPFVCHGELVASFAFSASRSMCVIREAPARFPAGSAACPDR